MTEHGAEAVGYVCGTIIVLAMIAGGVAWHVLGPPACKPVPAERAPAVPR